MALSMILLWPIVVALLFDHLKAMPCTIGQEPDPASHHILRWVIPVEDPCRCTLVEIGGWKSYAPFRPFKVSYYDSFLHSDNQTEIKEWLNCTSVSLCLKEIPLGIEDGTIPDDSITASTVYFNPLVSHGPERARLNTQDKPAAWCSNGDKEPWIQVDFGLEVHITALITQGRGDFNQWVEIYQVAESDDNKSWNLVTRGNGTTTKFVGNINMQSQVTNRFRKALLTRFLRILPIEWNGHCSMRFEVIGCRLSE